jgi:hypothetical protein
MSDSMRQTLALAERRQQVADLYLQGWSQGTIAKTLDIAQSTVSDDLQTIREEWRASSIRDFELARQMELLKLERIEREAWAAWERSQKPSQSADIRDGDQSASPAPTRKRIKNQYGDPRFLSQIAQCISCRRALLGLDLGTITTELPINGLTLETQRDRIITVIESLRQRQRIADSGTGTSPDQSGNIRAVD